MERRHVEEYSGTKAAGRFWRSVFGYFELWGDIFRGRDSISVEGICWFRKIFFGRGVKTFGQQAVEGGRSSFPLRRRYSGSCRECRGETFWVVSLQRYFRGFFTFLGEQVTE